MRSGRVFDIKEFAIHDGPGIRVTVFMKGCPLRCSWCHNPEGLSGEPQIIRRQDGERIVGTEYTSKKLAHLINDKAAILRANEGGVTFSGGEPLLQAEFLAEVIDQLDAVHVLLDTSGYGREQDFRLLVDKSDLVFFDLKLADNKLHQTYTGAGNATILSNLQVLSSMQVPFIIRVPLVPSVTDTDKNLSEIAGLAKGLPGLRGVELLPYNRAAGAKYGSLGMIFNPEFDESLDLNANTAIFKDVGLEIHVV